jgi:hypothetical protein
MPWKLIQVSNEDFIGQFNAFVGASKARSQPTADLYTSDRTLYAQQADLPVLL